MKLYRFLKDKFLQVNNKRGVTIVELLVVIAVIGVAMIPASQALMNGMNTYAIETENMERVYDAQGTLDYITDRVRFNADHVIKIIDTNTVDALVEAGAQGQGLKIDEVIIYYNGSEIIERANDTPKTLLENAKGMVFEISEETVEVEKEGIIKEEKKMSRFDVAITLEKKEYGDETFKTTVYLRN